MTSPYHVHIGPTAHQQIKMLQPKTRKIIMRLVESLSVNPRPPGSRKIDGMTGLYSSRIEDKRLIYKIDDMEVLLLLVK